MTVICSTLGACMTRASREAHPEGCAVMRCLVYRSRYGLAQRLEEVAMVMRRKRRICEGRVQTLAMRAHALRVCLSFRSMPCRII